MSINYFTRIPDILLGEVSKVQKKLYSIPPLCKIEDETEPCVYIRIYSYILIFAKLNTVWINQNQMMMVIYMIV